MKSVYLADVLTLDVEDRLQWVQAIWDSIAEVPSATPLTDDERKLLGARLESYREEGDSGDLWGDVKSRLLSRQTLMKLFVLP